MSISPHPTPNPNARKYVLHGVRFAQPANYASAGAAAHYPLAARLMALPGVYNVFMAQDFVTVNKRPDAAWDEVEAQVLLELAEFLETGDKPT